VTVRRERHRTLREMKVARKFRHWCEETAIPGKLEGCWVIVDLACTAPRDVLGGSVGVPQIAGSDPIGRLIEESVPKEGKCHARHNDSEHSR